MGNAALKSNRVFDDAIGFDAFGFDGTSALKYHPSFYGPDADAVSFERRGAAEMHGVARDVDNEPQAAVVRQVPAVGAVSGSRSLRESPRRVGQRARFVTPVRRKFRAPKQGRCVTGRT